MDKKEIRSHIRKFTNALNAADKALQATDVSEQLYDIIALHKPNLIAAFMPMKDEIAINIAHLSRLCRVAIPRITCNTDGEASMEFYDYRPSDICSGAYGIDEPQGSEIIPPDKIDIMIQPGVAFTLQGDRLGRGKGFYDRYTSREGFRAYCIGVCFKHQVLDELPTEPHDRRVNKVITSRE